MFRELSADCFVGAIGGLFREVSGSYRRIILGAIGEVFRAIGGLFCGSYRRIVSGSIRELSADYFGSYRRSVSGRYRRSVSGSMSLLIVSSPPIAPPLDSLGFLRPI